jgi:hypothetical protein
MDRAWMPTTSGILDIICGAVNVIMGFAVLIGGSFFTAFMPMMNSYGSGGAAFAIVLALTGIVIIAVGAVAIVGGIFALRRKMWGMALAGAIAAFFSWTSILGIASIVIIAMSRDQFNRV